MSPYLENFCTSCARGTATAWNLSLLKEPPFASGLYEARTGGSGNPSESHDRFLSPIEAPESENEIEVLVSAYKREGMLAAERGDPKIVGGNGLAFPFQFEAYG